MLFVPITIYTIRCISNIFIRKTWSNQVSCNGNVFSVCGEKTHKLLYKNYICAAHAAFCELCDEAFSYSCLISVRQHLYYTNYRYSLDCIVRWNLPGLAFKNCVRYILLPTQLQKELSFCTGCCKRQKKFMKLNT